MLTVAIEGGKFLKDLNIKIWIGWGNILYYCLELDIVIISSNIPSSIACHCSLVSIYSSQVHLSVLHI